VKIFISYSRRDAGDFANQVDRHLSNFKYDIFTDVNDIRGGDVWNKTIEENISDSDIFVVILTHGALHSSYVEREVLQAQKEKKTIIPCFLRSVRRDKIKWGLEKIQGIEFDDRYELVRELYLRVNTDDYIPNNQVKKNTSNSNSKSLEEKAVANSLTKSDNDMSQKKDSQSQLTARIGTIGSGMPSLPPTLREENSLSILKSIAIELKHHDCEKMVKWNGNKISFGLPTVDVGTKINMGLFSNKIVELVRASNIAAGLDNSQYLLCMMKRSTKDPNLKISCERIQLLIVFALTQLESIFETIKIDHSPERRKELADWIKYCSTLNKYAIEAVSSGTIGDQGDYEIEDIMKYQNITNDEMYEALKELER
jgi:hypothetical protein